MSNTNLEDVIVQLTETRNELSEEDLRLWDGLENERVSRIAGDDANKSLTLQVQDSVSGTERRLSTEVIHREQGDLDKLGVLNQLSQSLSAYRIKTDKEIEAERFARDILGINLDARITTAEASFNHKELKLYQDIQEVFTDLDGKYSSMDARIKKYEDMLQDITMDSIKITMDNGEINMGAWTILSQAREWDLEILAKMRGFQEKTNEDVNQALEELQNKLPITENIINEIMETLSESPLISELRDALNEGIDYSSDLAVKLAQEKADRAREMIDLAYANAQALAAEKAALAESLAAEAQARADEVQEEADRRIESIRQIRADLAQDVGELNDQVDSIREGAIADKAGILETVNNYKTELKSDIATVNTELLGALDGVHTLVTEVRDENGVTLNELTTYKTSNDVAVAGILSKVTTNISNTAANASKITGLTSELATTNTELGTVRNTSANALSKANTAVTANSALATRVDSLAAAITDLGEGAETTVDVYAFNALKAEVVTNSSGITSLVEQVDALGTSYTNLTDGVQANTDAVSTLTVKQSEMNGDISQLSSDVTFLTSELGVTNTALNSKASNQALSNLSTKLTTTDGKVAANTQQLTQLNTDFATVRDGLETKASTEALNNLATEVTELEGGLAVNASAITSLKSEIDTELNKKATVTAVNGLTTKVEEVEGKTTTNANNLLALNTTVGNVVKGLATKLDASTISDYYTKSQSDAKASEIAAGKVEEFNANLSIGLDNLLPTQIDLWEDGYWNVTSGGAYPGAMHSRTKSDVQISVTAEEQYSLRSDKRVVLVFYSAENERTGSYDSGTSTPPTTAQVITIPANSTYARAYLFTPSGAMAKPVPFDQAALVGLQGMLVKGTHTKLIWQHSSLGLSNQINANSTAIQNTDAEVSRVDGRVTATNSAQTLLEGRVENVEGGIATKADASALSSLDTRVGTVEGQYTTQASDITKLSNSLDTTNVNLGTAQTAAQNALNAAGAKGKVIFGNTAPTVEDRLVQNLWIDTTSNDNTPKRWNGSAWVAVTDKVAVDAAKAVSDLDTVVKTKADVTALNSLTTKVTDDAKKTTANTNNITELNSDIVKINNDLATKANASALSDMYTKNEVDDKAAEIAAGEVSKYDASLVIGGANLVDHDPAEWSQGSIGEARSEGASYASMHLSSGVRIRVNEVIPVRGEAFVVSAKNSNYDCCLALFDSNGGYLGHTIGFKGFKQTHFIEAIEGGGYVAIVLRKIDNTVVSPFDIVEAKVKLEYGTKATDWSPSADTLQKSLDANATAITNTNTEVSRVDGRVTTESNRITTLSGRVTTAENGLALKADTTALNNIYTKTESDAKATSLAAGEISKYDASLVIGGSNLVDHRAEAWSQGSIIESTSAGSSYTSLYFAMSARVRIKELIAVREEAFVVSVKNSNYDCCIALFDSNSGYLGRSTGFLGFKSTHFIKALVDGGFVAVVVRKVDNTALTPSDMSEALVQLEYGTKSTDWSPSSNVVLGAIDANASAISTTNSEVTRIDGEVKGHSEQISDLTTSVAGKASSDALAALTVRVKDTEGMTSTQAESITSLTSTAEDLLDVVTVKDTRSTNQPPSWYWANYPRRTVNEFKSQTAIGVSGLFGGTYCNLETRVYYSDASGGGIIQTATSSNDTSAYVQRTSSGSSTAAVWTAWTQPIKDIRDSLGTKASASAVSTLTTKVNDIDGLVTSQAEQITTLTSDNSDNKNALQVQAKVIDGVKASYMVKMETNGVIGGFGLMQSTGALGQVQTSFGVNANSFFIGAPASKKQPFIVTTTNQVVNGVKYPAGTYIDVALIANATIGNAHIADASITNAKIKELDASKITTGTLDAKRIRVGSTSQFDTGYAPTDVLNDAKSYTDAIEVGGRNLLLNSKELDINYSSRTYSFFSHSLDDLNTLKGSYVTLSFEGKADSGNHSLYVSLANNATSIIYLIPHADSLGFLTTEWKRYTFTALVTNTSVNLSNILYAVGYSGGVQSGIVNLRNIKLEKGNKATDWTPAPEDVDVAIASKSKTFTAQPVPPYTSGDLWRNGATIRVCTVTRASGSYVAADWILVGDVTSANTAADASKLGGKASATVLSDITGAKNAADAAALKASSAENQLTLWKYPNTTEIDGGKIRTNSITANKINASVFKSVGADGSSSTISGGTIRAYYPNGKIAFHIGVS